MDLARFPREFLGHLPTALEAAPRISDALGKARVWLKRDDCTGLAGGGNKTRKLEFLMADALAQDADVILTQGAVQSNHARQTAAAAAKYNLPCHVLLEDRTESTDDNHLHNGNVLLDNLFGAQITRHAKGADMAAAMAAAAESLTQYKKPYLIPGGGSNAIGALGYVNAAFELVYQANQQGLKIDCIVHATGSCGTQAGLVAGLWAMNANIPVLGISVRHPRAKQAESVLQLARATASLLGLNGDELPAERVWVNSDYVGEGYGFPADSTLAAIRQTAMLEGVLLDPVYSGKGMAGLMGCISQAAGGEGADVFCKGKNVVFIHTGGAQALPAYKDYF